MEASQDHVDQQWHRRLCSAHAVHQRGSRGLTEDGVSVACPEREGRSAAALQTRLAPVSEGPQAKVLPLTLCIHPVSTQLPTDCIICPCI